MRSRADRNVGVFLRTAPSADRFHLSAVVDDGDLSDADLFEFCSGAAAAQADPLGAFAQYMSPALVEQLAQSPEKLVLGGEEREMTIMFSDVRGFTTDLGDLQERSAGPHRADESLPDAADERHPRAQGLLSTNTWATPSWRSGTRRSTTRTTRSTPARRRSTCSIASTSSIRQRERRRRTSGHAVHSAQRRHRPQYRHLRRRQHGVRSQVQLFGARRQRQSGLAAGRAVEGVRLSDHRRLHGPRSRSRRSSRFSNSTSSW